MKIKHFKIVLLLCLSVAVFAASAQNKAKDEILKGMDEAALEWNKGNLYGYMALYDSTATMMTKTGRIGITAMRDLYVKYYFVGSAPKQQLSYDNYQLTMLGNDYALLTGRFILKANGNLPERTGTYSLVFIHRATGWKLLHDHSG